MTIDVLEKYSVCSAVDNSCLSYPHFSNISSLTQRHFLKFNGDVIICLKTQTTAE